MCVLSWRGVTILRRMSPSAGGEGFDGQMRVLGILHLLDERLVQVRQVGPTDTGGLVNVGNAPCLDSTCGQLTQVHLYVGRDGQAAGPAVLGVELDHPDPDFFEECNVVPIGV